MRKEGLEFKVGIFSVIAIAILIGLVMKTGNTSLKPGYTVRLLFDFVSGVESGSPVRLAGVNVGEVKEIHVRRDEAGQTRVEITVWIEQGVFIETDAKVRINSLGLLGEKYIEILPGTSGQPTVPDGGTIVGVSPLVFEDIADSGQQLFEKLEVTADSVNSIVSDPKFRSSVKGTFGNSEQVSKNLIETTADLKDAARSAKIVLARMRDGEGSVGRLMKDDKIAKDLEAFVADIKAHPWKLLKKG